MLYIEGQVHMGMGDHSYAYMGYLHQRLSHAFTILSGIQQPPHATDSEESCRQYEQDVEDGEIELEQIAREIYLGLTGVRPPRISQDSRVEATGLQPTVEKAGSRLLNWVIGGVLLLQVVFFIYLFFFL